jgi:hypothetical protein
MSKHTPGPWHIPTTPGSSGGIAHANGYVAFTAIPRDVSDERAAGESWLDMRNRTKVERDSIRTEQEANQFLITAAPDMFEALDNISGLSRALRSGGPDPMDLQGLSDALEEAISLALSAMAKVTGQ